MLNIVEMESNDENDRPKEAVESEICRIEISPPILAVPDPSKFIFYLIVDNYYCYYYYHY